MSSKKSNWLLIALISLFIGSSAALGEKFINKLVDSLLPDSEKLNSFSRPGTLSILSTNGRVIQKLGPATREKIDRKRIPLVIKQAFIAS